MTDHNTKVYDPNRKITKQDLLNIQVLHEPDDYGIRVHGSLENALKDLEEGAKFLLEIVNGVAIEDLDYEAACTEDGGDFDLNTDEGYAANVRAAVEAFDRGIHQEQVYIEHGVSAERQDELHDSPSPNAHRSMFLGPWAKPGTLAHDDPEAAIGEFMKRNNVK